MGFVVLIANYFSPIIGNYQETCYHQLFNSFFYHLPLLTIFFAITNNHDTGFYEV